MHSPTSQHWLVLERLLRYLNGSIDKGISLRKNSTLVLNGFTDTDWVGDKESYKNTTGYIVYLGTNPIAWSSKKSKTLARSSTEAEFRAVAATTAKFYGSFLFLRNLA